MKNFSILKTRSMMASHIIMVVSIVIFFALKFGGPFWVMETFKNGQIDVLNQFLRVQGDASSLTFYLGLAEQKWFGPLSQSAAAIAFMIFSLCYLRTATVFRFGLSVFIFLLITKYEVLFLPPYGDAIGGPFAEAIWLSRHHFDYVGLFHQPDYAQGGPRVYLFSIYPTYLAIGMKILRNPVVFLIVFHQIVFLMISSVASMLRQASRKVFSDSTAMLVTILFLFMPLVQSQTESLNMEPPCVFFVMLSAYFLIQKKIARSSLAAIGAVLVKGTGIMACGAVALASVFLFIVEFRVNRKWSWKYLFWLFVMLAVPCLELFSKYFINDAHVSAGMVGLFNGLPSLKVLMIVRWFAASLLIYLCALAFSWKKLKGTRFFTGTMYVFGVAYFVLLLNFFAVSPRYTLSVYPFLIFSVVYSMTLLVKNNLLQKTVIIGAAVTMAFASYGYFYSPVNDHVILERSLEYRHDVRLDQNIAKTIEDRYDSFTIVAPMQIAQILALQELGYVKKELDVVIYGFSCYYGGIKNFVGLENLDRRRLVFIGKKSDADPSQLIVPEYPVDPRDHILEILTFGNRKAWIFSGGIAIEKLYRIVKMFQASSNKKIK